MWPRLSRPRRGQQSAATAVGTEMSLLSYLAVTHGRDSRPDLLSAAFVEAQHLCPALGELLGPRRSHAAAGLASPRRRTAQTSSFMQREVGPAAGSRPISSLGPDSRRACPQSPPYRTQVPRSGPPPPGAAPPPATLSPAVLLPEATPEASLQPQ